STEIIILSLHDALPISKPSLAQYDGKNIPGHEGVAMASPFKFTKRGKSGIEVSEVFPKLGDMADDLAVIRSMYTDVPAHEVATRSEEHTSELQSRSDLV